MIFKYNLYGTVEPNSQQSSLKFTWSQLKFDSMSRGSQAEAEAESQAYLRRVGSVDGEWRRMGRGSLFVGFCI